MSPTLEETARAIAEQRREAGKQLFKATYPDLLPSLEGSQMFYIAAINDDEKLEIIFSKLGIPKLALPLLPDGKVSKRLGAEGMTPEALTTLLAVHIAKQEALIRQAEKQAAWNRKYGKFFYAWFAVIIVTGVVFIYRFWGLSVTHLEGADVTMKLALLLILELTALGIYAHCLPDPQGSEV
jgi:hypothetical protein